MSPYRRQEFWNGAYNSGKFVQFYICKLPPRRGHEGPEGEQKNSATVSLTKAIYGAGGQRHVPAVLPPGKNRYPLYRRVGGSQSRFGRVQKTSSTLPPGFDPQTVQPVASRYTDWAIPALCVCVCVYVYIYMRKAKP
jgi:hypothetical protein